MAALVEAKDWSSTPLGPVAHWPQGLRTTVGICLRAPTPMALWWGPDRTFIYNDAYVPILGDKHPEALGRSGRDVSAEAWPQIEPLIEAAARGESVVRGRDHFRLDRNGSPADAWITWTLSAVPDESGGVGGVLKICHEDAAQVCAERDRFALQGQEDARTILESITDAFFAVGPDWRFTYVNRQAEQVLGCPPQDLIGKVVWDVYPGLSGSEFERAYRRTASERVATSFTAFYRDHNRWYEVHVFPAPDGGISIYLRDVTERTRAEAQIHRSHDTFYNLIQNNPFGVYVVDADFRLRQVSLGSRKVFENVRPLIGRDFAEVLRTVWAEPFASEAIALFRHTLDTGEAYSSPSTVERRQDIGDVEAYDWRIERITLPDGRFGVVCYFYDLSERQRWEAALQESEARLSDQKQAFELAVAGTPLHDVLNVLVQAGQRHFGPSARTAIFMVHPDGGRLRFGAAAGLPEGYTRAIDGLGISPENPSCGSAAYTGKAVIVRDVAGDPLWAPYLHLAREHGIRACWSFPIRSVGGEVIGTFDVYHDSAHEPDARDLERANLLARTAGLVIERSRAEEALRHGEAQFRQLADALPQIVWVTRPDGYHEYYNRRWYEFTGVPQGSTDGEGWNGMFHPDDQERAWAAWRHSLATGEPYEVEYRLRHRSGTYLWTLGRALPIRNDRGEIERWFGTCTDIDTLKRLTAEREQLLESERAARTDAEAANRAKDKFLAVLSHELRTPLSPVVMTIPSLEIDPEMPSKFRDDLAMVRRNIDLEVKLIDDLLDLSRVTSGKLRLHMQRVRAHELLLHVVQSSAGETAGKHLRVRHELRAANDLLSGDPARLQQVFWNLLRNAIKFTPDGGEIVVRTSNRAGDGQLLVEVSDSGVGIRPDILPRIFDAFEQGELRMTRQFGGMGLGLAIAKAVVEMHGGTIGATSGGPNRGATFTVSLPTLSRTGPSEPQPAAAPAATRQRDRSRVLLVEDHPDTARAMATLLRRSGYLVTAAHSVASALHIAAAEPFDIVVSDIGLPDATGYELMEQLRDRHGITGIALSGYGMEEDMRKSREAGFVDHVIKPVNVAQLEAVIERVLADSRTK